MNADQALTILRRETGRKTQAELAEDVGVSEGTISRWLNTKSPPKRGLSDLVRWAERQDSYVEPVSTVGRVREQGVSAQSLAELRGQARAVLAMLHAVVAEQQQLVDGLEPWSLADALTRQAPLTPNATPEALEAATARQLKADAEAARGKARGA